MPNDPLGALVHLVKQKPAEPMQSGSAPNQMVSGSTLAKLDFISFVMDRWLPIPGTRWRIGLNSLVMLVPVVGDAVANLVSAGILVTGLTHYRVPRIVAVRMVLNTLLDTTVGWIPVLGDVFDFFYKADTRNVRLLQEYVGQGALAPHSTWRHWVFVLSLGGVLVLILGLLVLSFVALVAWMQPPLAPR